MRKRTLAAAAWILSCVLAVSGCQRKKITPPANTAALDLSGLSSAVSMAEPGNAFQLIRGFHPVEQNAWRWTMRKFAVALRPPQGARQHGAMLGLRFAIPDVVIQKLGQVTLSAAVGNQALSPQTYSKPGPAEYARTVPAAAFTGDAATVEFTLERALAAGTVDSRELGVVASEVALSPR